MSTSTTRRLSACVAAALLAGGAATHAQVRFDAPRRETIAAIPGLDIVTIRDNVLNACYVLFVMEPAMPPASPARTESKSIQDLAADRDRQLAALLAEYEHSQYAAVPGFPIPNPLRYSWEGDRVQSEYERKVRDKEASRLEEQLVRLANSPRLAVAGPVSCGPPAPPKK